jgi:sensor histidine kinase YesM
MFEEMKTQMSQMQNLIKQQQGNEARQKKLEAQINPRTKKLKI